MQNKNGVRAAVLAVALTACPGCLLSVLGEKLTYDPDGSQSHSAENLASIVDYYHPALNRDPVIAPLFPGEMDPNVDRERAWQIRNPDLHQGWEAYKRKHGIKEADVDTTIRFRRGW